MKIQRLIIALFAFLVMHAGSALAVGTFIPAANRVDMAHDSLRNIVYITSGGSVLRYHIPTATFLAPINLGGQLAGIDLNDDKATLAVADMSSSATEQWIYLVRLSDLAVTKVPMTKESGEDGTWSVAFLADWSVAVSGRFAGSGWVPMRKLNLNTLQWQKIGTAYPDNTFRQDTMLSPQR